MQEPDPVPHVPVGHDPEPDPDPVPHVPVGHDPEPDPVGQAPVEQGVEVSMRAALELAKRKAPRKMA